MTERNYVDQDFKLAYTGVFDVDELYKSMYRWLRKHGYIWKELDCRDYKRDGVRKCFFKWEAEKEVSDYVKYKMEVELTMNACKDVMVGKKKKMQAALTMKFAAFTLSDFEESWTRSSLLKFIKEEYQTLPFCSRWIVKKFGSRSLLALKRLEDARKDGDTIYAVIKGGGGT